MFNYVSPINSISVNFRPHKTPKNFLQIIYAKLETSSAEKFRKLNRLTDKEKYTNLIMAWIKLFTSELYLSILTLLNINEAI